MSRHCGGRKRWAKCPKSSHYWKSVMTTIQHLSFGLTCKCEALSLNNIGRCVSKNNSQDHCYCQRQHLGNYGKSPPASSTDNSLRCERVSYHSWRWTGWTETLHSQHTLFLSEIRAPILKADGVRLSWEFLQSYAWMCPSHLWGCALEAEVLKVCFCVSARGAGGWRRAFEKL